jgi:hypothetical protein
MVNALKKHVDKDTALKEVVFVGFSEDLTDAFQITVENILL